MLRGIIFRLVNWAFSTEKDLLKSKNSILTLLFSCDNQRLSSEESIQLWTETEKEFEVELKKRYLEHQMESTAIDNYFRNKENRNNN